jgi:hypothetical protein
LFTKKIDLKLKKNQTKNNICKFPNLNINTFDQINKYFQNKDSKELSFKIFQNLCNFNKDNLKIIFRNDKTTNELKMDKILQNFYYIFCEEKNLSIYYFYSKNLKLEKNFKNSNYNLRVFLIGEIDNKVLTRNQTSLSILIKGNLKLKKI